MRAAWFVIGFAIVGCGGDGGPAASPDAGSPDGGGGPGAVGTWTDEPGACPAGASRVDVTTAAELAAAARGEGPIADCYYIHDGDYPQSGTSPILYVTRGGTAARPVVFVGQSRAGVHVRGRAAVDVGAAYVELANLTLDLTGYVQSGSFNTVTILADHVTLRRTTLTGDCATGLRGGAVEVDGGDDALIEDNLIERFGQCAADGHLDHGVYLASGARLTVRNNLIRGNSSRGIQLNTEGGAFGTLADVVIERNRITGNGHRDYEDGIVVNGSGTGTIAGLAIRRNVIDGNYYSGVRFVGDVITGVTVDHNTLYANGAASTAPGRSELNLDDGTPVGTVTRNLVVPARTLINTCAAGLAVTDNLVHGDATGGCVSGTVDVDPGFVDAAAGDFHPTAAAAQAYGAYAP